MLDQASQVLQEQFGHQAFRPVQAAVIERLLSLEGGHVLLLLPTGGGKSLCYQVPALCLSGGTLVISPLIALMHDQVQALRANNIAAHYVNSTVSRADRERRIAAFVRGDLKLLYVTPERFRKESFVQSMQSAQVDLLAVDEAHCISEWGHDFRPDYSRVGEFRALIGNPRTIALTATATPEVQQDILSKLHLQPAGVMIVNEGVARENLMLTVCDLYGDDSKLERILAAREEYPGPGVVYFSLIQTLERFSQLLKRKGLPHDVYHGKLHASDRRRAQERFLANKSTLMLATNAFGMGVDKPDIRRVQHAEIPGSLEAYYQEIGRAGRDGKPSLCELLYDEDDLSIQMDFVKWSNPDAGFYQRVYQTLRDHMPAVHSMGFEYLREQLHWKHKRDFRAETALGMMDRYGVTTGSVEKRDLELVSALPPELSDETALAAKLQRNRMQLLELVQYVRATHCRRRVIAQYFGAEATETCEGCDVCLPD